MKSIIVLITLVSGFSTFAFEGVDELTEVSHTVAQISSVDAKIASVQLNDSGVLTITKRDKTSQTLKLSDTNQQGMLWSAQLLAESELQTDKKTIVCAMMINPLNVQNLMVLDVKTKKMKLVLSYNSCAISEFIHPKDAYVMEAAQTLKAQMLVLAQQLVK